MGVSRHCPHVLFPRLALFLGFLLFTGLSGCGPAVSDRTPNQGIVASSVSPTVAQPSERQGSSTDETPVVSPKVLEAPVPLPEYLTLSPWMAQALDAPDASVRLQALDAWVQQGGQTSWDPLLVALDDEDDGVREKAMAIIEEQWAVWQAGEGQHKP